VIDCVSIATAHLFGDAIAAQYRLRYRIFIERRQWGVPAWEGMEFDQFDTPATTYFVWRDAAGEARGVARIAPTQLPYMLQTLWPEMVTKEPLPSSSRIWEGSRIGIDETVEPVTRRRVLGELFCAYLEFGLRKDIDRFLVMMPLAFLRRTVAPLGWPPHFIGPVRQIGRRRVVAASMNVSMKVLENVRIAMGIEGPVLRTKEDLPRSKAA
jgi:N-acyl-L-homoserine lactone synthetase